MEAQNFITTINISILTKFDRFLRKTKQRVTGLWNVFVVDMSIVDPRLHVKGYVDKL